MDPEDKKLPTYLVRPYLDLIEQVGRNVCRYYISHPKYERPEGITALVLLLDEPMAYESVEAILPYVDEVVVVDASETITTLPTNDKIQYVHTPAEQNMQVKIGLLLSRYRWILRWDGDFSVATDLKKFLQLTLEYPTGFWQIKGMVRNIDHLGTPVLLQKESYLFTYHPYILVAEYSWAKKLCDLISKLRGGLPGRICYGTLPPFFRMVNTHIIYANHHYENKSLNRLLEREYQAEWSLLTDAQRAEYTDFKEYVACHSGGVYT